MALRSWCKVVRHALPLQAPLSLLPHVAHRPQVVLIFKLRSWPAGRGTMCMLTGCGRSLGTAAYVKAHQSSTVGGQSCSCTHLLVELKSNVADHIPVAFFLDPGCCVCPNPQAPVAQAVTVTCQSGVLTMQGSTLVPGQTFLWSRLLTAILW